MTTMQLTLKQILEFIILGINNGNYQAAKNLAQDYLDELKKREKENNEE